MTDTGGRVLLNLEPGRLQYSATSEDLLVAGAMPANEMLKATEAAVAARVSLRDVNGVIDFRIGGGILMRAHFELSEKNVIRWNCENEGAPPLCCFFSLCPLQPDYNLLPRQAWKYL